MKNNVDNGVAIFIISILLMPIVTMISLLMLQNQLLESMDALQISVETFSNVFIAEIIWYITSWIALFISYFFHNLGLRGVQAAISTIALAFFIVSVATSFELYASLSRILSPLIVLTASTYSVFNPLKKAKNIEQKPEGNEIDFIEDYAKKQTTNNNTPKKEKLDENKTTTTKRTTTKKTTTKKTTTAKKSNKK